jgi:hypothetical protein
MMRKTSMMLAVMVLMLAASSASAANEVYLDPHPVYIPECGNATVQVLLNATNTTDTWSTMIEFDNNSVNITNVTFTDSISTNASWGHHGDHIYLGGVSLNYETGDGLILANLTVECIGEGGCTNPLSIAGDEGVERLIAGPPDDAEPHNGTIHLATWTDGSAQCVGCGDVTISAGVNQGDVTLLLNHLYSGYSIDFDWAADVTGIDGVNQGDVTLLLNHLYSGYSLNCNCTHY